jgi:hypothetical protein
MGPADVDLEAGAVVGEYKVDGVLGRGGFGTVYKATHPLIGKVAAIKVLSHQFSANPEIVSRFVAEAKAVNQIRHPNIIDIFSFGALPDGRQYYVMEFLDGEPLDKRIARQQRLTLAEALPILRGIAKALDAAHAKGIAHRDLKAENVLLAATPEGEVWPKLLDFGIAKLSGDEALKHKTRTGAPMGTPLYMSPEQARGRDVDQRTDLYALGVLVYVMLTGKFPIDGEDYMTILMRQIADEPQPPSTHVAELPEAVDHTVAWLMRKEAADRPESALAAVRALEGSVAAPAPKKRTTTVDMRGRAVTPPDLDAPSGRGRLLAIAGAVIVAGGIAAAIVIARRGEKREAPVAIVTPDAAPVVVDAAPVTVAIDAPDKHVVIRILGVPENTEVRVGKDLVGTAPGPVTLERFDTPSVVLLLTAEGYKPASLTVTKDKLEYTPAMVKRPKLTRPAGSAEPTDDIDDFPKKNHP